MNPRMTSTRIASSPELKTPPSAAARMVIAIKITVMIRESMICARKRLPMPAISYWKATRSGVEMTRSSDASGGCTSSLYPPFPKSASRFCDKNLPRPSTDFEDGVRHHGDVRADEFVSRRRPEWDRLEKLLSRAGTSRAGGLRPTEVLTLAALYRRATADFARARRALPTQPGAGYF